MCFPAGVPDWRGTACMRRKKIHHKLIRSCAQTVVVGQRFGRMKLLGTM
jgi:hypothetical protein